MKRVGILDIPSRGMLGGVSAELILALSTAFRELGVETTYSRHHIERATPTLVFNYYRLFIDGKIPTPLPPSAHIFNLSPIVDTDKAWYRSYISYLSEAASVIDYSDLNLRKLQTYSPDKRRFRFTFGYLPLSAMRFPERNTEWLFYGKLNDYRSTRLKQLAQQGLRLKVLNNVWGFERDLQIATCRAVVNFGKFERNILEVYRLWHTLCLGTPVLSERGVDEVLTREWTPYVTYVDRIAHAQDLEAALVSPARFQTETSFHNNARELFDFIQA